MVLQELGERLSTILQNVQTSNLVDEKVVDGLLKELSNVLLQSDVNFKQVYQLRESVKSTLMGAKVTKATQRRALLKKVLMEELVKMLTGKKTPYNLKKGKCNVVMFVGLQGAGKTTSCTKYAQYYSRRGWRTSLVCADTFRAGAFDQLKQNAAKARIPFYGSYTEADPARIAKMGVEKFKNLNRDLIIVDTSGRHMQEKALFDEMKEVEDAVNPDEVIFVVDSHIGQACFEQAQAFNDFTQVGSVILTKLDGCAKGGGAISAVAATGSPITFVGTGEGFADFQPFDPESFVSKLLGLGDLKGLYKNLQEAIPLDKQPEFADRIAKGVFSMRDLRNHLSSVLQMGSFKNLMSMIPGLPNDLVSSKAEEASIYRIKRTMIMMDSMTTEELDQDKPWTISRMLRVAHGSGADLDEVGLMLEQYKDFQKMIQRMGKSGLTKQSVMNNMMRNPSQMLNKVSGAIDSRILQSMGGAENMVKVIRQLNDNKDCDEVKRKVVPKKPTSKR